VNKLKFQRSLRSVAEVGRIKVHLHAAICRVRFIFWRMRNTVDTTVFVNATYLRLLPLLHTPECESYLANCSV
jgi:hypothetical protein